MMNKQELLLSDLQFYEEKGKIEIVGGPKNANFCAVVTIASEMRQYLLKEVTHRRDMSDRITLELKNLCFEFQHP
jgi:hypothetical protein